MQKYTRTYLMMAVNCSFYAFTMVASTDHASKNVQSGSGIDDEDFSKLSYIEMKASAIRTYYEYFTR